MHCTRNVQGLVLVLREEYTILCLGLSRSGKTTLLQHLVGEDCGSRIACPTTGFNMKTIPLSSLFPEADLLAGRSVSFKEIGGSKSVRPFWNHYYQDKNAILFVVDAASGDKDINLAKQVLKEVLSDPELDHKPCLIVGTHFDMDGARDASQLEALFSDVMSCRKWSVRVCCAFNEKQVKSVLGVLIDLIIEK